MPKARLATFNARDLTTTALLSAAASILMFLSFSLPIFPSFIKMDFSDMAGLLAAFIVGPYAGVIVEFVKNIINILHTTTGGIGEIASFVMGCSLVVPAGLIYRWKKTKKSAAAGLVAGVLTRAAVSAFANYYVLIPLYAKIAPVEAIIAMYSEINPYATTLPRVILTSVVPFNIIKGGIEAALAFALFRRISRARQGKRPPSGGPGFL